MGGNTSTSFDHGKATQDADEILNIAKQVSKLFDETEAEIPPCSHKALLNGVKDFRVPRHQTGNNAEKTQLAPALHRLK